MCIAFLVVRTIISFAKPGTKSITNVLFCISIMLRPFENELTRVELTRGCIIESKNQRSHSVIIFFPNSHELLLTKDTISIVLSKPGRSMYYTCNCYRRID